MNNKELILSKINELRFTNKHGDEFEQGFNNALDCISNFLNSLPAELPSEGLDIAAEENLPNAPYSVKQDNFGGYVGVYGQCQMLDMFKSGANWQKEQMMKGFCHETKVYRDEEGDGIDTPIESWLALENNEITNLPNIGLKEGDKVKVIIVKEDEK
ncbi:MAG: hypothetical protein SPM02_00830 [Bacteroidales bacterium]|nr:hypothetical protein [Bacteroidales bacterium]